MSDEEITKETIEREVLQITGAERGSDDFELGCVMLAACFVGVNVARISKLLERGYDPTQELVEQCRRTGIFTRNRVLGGGWFDDNGGMEFCLDIAVAKGWLQRV